MDVAETCVTVTLQCGGSPRTVKESVAWKKLASTDQEADKSMYACEILGFLITGTKEKLVGVVMGRCYEFPLCARLGESCVQACSFIRL